MRKLIFINLYQLQIIKYQTFGLDMSFSVHKPYFYLLQTTSWLCINKIRCSLFTVSLRRIFCMFRYANFTVPQCVVTRPLKVDKNGNLNFNQLFIIRRWMSCCKNMSDLFKTWQKPVLFCFLLNIFWSLECWGFKLCLEM